MKNNDREMMRDDIKKRRTGVFVSPVPFFINHRLARWRKKEKFTLLELVVVIVILGLTAVFAVSTIRTDSPAARIRDAALNFESFCSTVRFQAMEEGSEKTVIFFPEKMLLEVKESPLEGRTVLSWKLPDGFSLVSDQSAADDADEDGSLELFRFFPDGSAIGRRIFSMKCGELVKKFEISPLTGRFMFQEEETIQ